LLAISPPRVMSRGWLTGVDGKQQTFRFWCTTAAAMTCPTMAPHNHACPQGFNFEAYPGSGQGYQLGSNYYMNGYGTTASTGSGAPQTVTQPS
jgi:hypothetical protein